jgi:hypothetical protein
MRIAVRLILAIASLAASLTTVHAQTKLTLGYGAASAWIASFVAAEQGILPNTVSTSRCASILACDQRHAQRE